MALLIIILTINEALKLRCARPLFDDTRWAGLGRRPLQSTGSEAARSASSCRPLSRSPGLALHRSTSCRIYGIRLLDAISEAGSRWTESAGSDFRPLR